MLTRNLLALAAFLIFVFLVSQAIAQELDDGDKKVTVRTSDATISDLNPMAGNVNIPFHQYLVSGIIITTFVHPQDPTILCTMRSTGISCIKNK